MSEQALDFSAILSDAMSPVLDTISANVEDLATVTDEATTGMSDAFATLTAAMEEMSAMHAENMAAALQDAGAMDTAAGSAQNLAASLCEGAGAADADAASVQADTDAAVANANAKDAGAGSAHRFNLALLAGGAAIALAAGASIKMAGDFQAGMTTLVTGAGESADVVRNKAGQIVGGIQMVSQGILQMAVDTGTSTKQLTDGMFMIESGGYRGAIGLNVLRVAAEGAKVGNADLGTTATALIGVMNDFASAHVTAAQAMNTLTFTVQDGLTHMQDLAGALPTVLSTANAAGVGLTDVAGAMATMTSQTVPAAQAATYLRQTIIALDAPGKLAKDTLVSVGLTSTEVSNEMKKSLPDTIAMITDAVGKKFPVGSAAYVAALKNIAGGSKTMQGLLDLSGEHLKTFGDDVKDIADKVKTSGNSVNGWSLIQQDFNFKMDHAREVVETLMISIGTHLMPVVGHIADIVANTVVPAIARFADYLEYNRTELIAVASVLGGVVLAAIVSLLAPLAAAALAAAPLIGILTSIGFVAAMVVTHWQDLVNFFESTSGPALAVKVVLVGIGAALLAWGATFIPAALVGLAGLIPALISGAVAAWAFVAPILVAAAPFIAIGAAVAALAFGIYELVTHWKQITTFIANVWNVTWHAVTSFFQATVAFIGNVARVGFQLLVAIITAPIHFIVGLFEWLFNHNYYFHMLVDFIEAEFNRAKELAMVIWLLIKDFIIKPIQQVWVDLQIIWHMVIGYLQDTWNTITGGAKAAWSTFVNTILGVVSNIKQAIDIVKHTILDPILNLGSLLLQAGENLIKMFAQGIMNSLGVVKNVIGNVAHSVVSFLGFHSPAEEGPGADADTWAPNLMHMFAGGLLAGLPEVRRAAASVAGALHGGFGATGGSGAYGGASAGYGGSGASSGETHYHFHLDNSITLLDPSARKALVQQIAQDMATEFSKRGSHQQIMAYGVTGVLQ